MLPTVYAAETLHRRETEQRDRELAIRALIRERTTAYVPRKRRRSRSAVGTTRTESWPRPIRIAHAEPAGSCA